MAEARLRELERRWRQSGSVEDEAALLRERVRVGDLVLHTLGLAAWVGAGAARVAFADHYLVMEADNGGQILLTCPVGALEAEQDAVQTLIYDLESFTWGSGELSPLPPSYSEAQLRFAQYSVGDSVPGGMRGGQITDGLWLHPELCRGKWSAFGLEEQVWDVLQGTKPRIELG